MNKNILIVDDDISILNGLKKSLTNRGYCVYTSMDADNAIGFLEKKPCCVAIVDLVLGDTNGLDLINRIKNISKNIVIIVMTGFGTIDGTIESLRKGVYDFIQKPCEMESFLTIVDSAVKRNMQVKDQERFLNKAKKKISRYDLLMRENLKLEEALRTDQRISSIHNFNNLIDFVIKRIAEIIQVEKCSIMFIDREAQELRIKGSVGLAHELILKSQVRVGEKVSGLVAESGIPLLVKNVEKDKNVQRTNRPGYKSKSFMCSPIIYRGRILGVVNVADKTSNASKGFTETDLKVLEFIICQAALSIENVRYSRRLEYQAQTDPITKINNYRFFVKSLDHEILRFRRYNRPLSLLMIDIDNFKEYNDHYGHLEGDALLRKVGKILKNNSREVDVVCRYAGDEFAIILPETNSYDAKKVAEKIVNSIHKSHFKEDVSISVGIGGGNGQCNRYDLILTADQALYAAKKEGKDCICCYG